MNGKRSRVSIEESAAKRRKTSPFEVQVVSNFDLLFIIFQFLPFRALLNVRLICQDWNLVSRDELLWKSLCMRTWPSCQNSIDLLYQRLQTYQLVFKVWFLADSCDWKNQENHLVKGEMRRFNFDQLLTYIELDYRGEKIWSKLQKGEELFSQLSAIPNSDLRRMFQAPLGTLWENLKVRISFFLLDGESGAWISDRCLHLFLPGSMEGDTLRLTLSEHFFVRDHEFLASLDFMVEDYQFQTTPLPSVQASFVFKGIMAFIVAPNPSSRGQAKATERHILGVLKRVLGWKRLF